MQTTRKSIVKDSIKIRELLKERFKDLNLKSRHIILDAKEKNISFTEASLSRYLNHGNIVNGLAEEHIVWLCIRYGIELRLLVGKPVLSGTKMNLVIPKYNEKECLEKLSKIFPWEKPKTLKSQKT